MTRSDFCLKRCSSQFEIPWTVHLHHRQSQNNARCLVAAHSIGRIGNFTRPSHAAYLMAPNPNDPAPMRNSILKGRIMRAAQQPRPPPQTLGKKGRKEGIGGRESHAVVVHIPSVRAICTHRPQATPTAASTKPARARRGQGRKKLARAPRTHTQTHAVRPPSAAHGRVLVRRYSHMDSVVSCTAALMFFSSCAFIPEDGHVFPYTYGRVAEDVTSVPVAPARYLFS